MAQAVCCFTQTLYFSCLLITEEYVIVDIADINQHMFYSVSFFSGNSTGSPVFSKCQHPYVRLVSPYKFIW